MSASYRVSKLWSPLLGHPLYGNSCKNYLFQSFLFSWLSVKICHPCTWRKLLRYAASGTTCTFTAVSRSTQPSTLRGTANEYQPYGWVIIPVAMGECSAYSSLPRRTQRSSLQLGLRVGGHLALTDFRSEDPKWTLAYTALRCHQCLY